MTTQHLKIVVLDTLKANPSGLSTRAICNKILREERNQYIIIPGTDKMNLVRYCLHSLLKKGLVEHPHSTFWKAQ